MPHIKGRGIYFCCENIRHQTQLTEMPAQESNTTETYEEQPATVPADERSTPGAPVKVRPFLKRLYTEDTNDDPTESQCKKPKNKGTHIVTVGMSQYSSNTPQRVIVMGESTVDDATGESVDITDPVIRRLYNLVYDPKHVFVQEPADKTIDTDGEKNP